MKKFLTSFILILLLLPPLLVEADTTLFTESCSSNPSVALPSSTSVSGGTWSARITLAGSPSTNINSGTANCKNQADNLNIGFGYTISIAPTDTEYYVRASLTDGGAYGTTEGSGVLMNYIDTSNYYVCLYIDDPAAAFDVYILKMSSGGNSTLASAANRPNMTSGDTVECRIAYSGGNPTITITNTTDAEQYLTATDSSSPLTETKKAGVMCGATPARTADDCNVEITMGTVTLSEVSIVAPTVQTNADTGVGVSLATLNGEITATGGANATVRGFAWGTSSILSGGDTATTTNSGDFGTGTWGETVYTLKAGTTYYFRAYATNSAGTGYGAIDAGFTTGTDNTPSRKMRLFQGYNIKVFNGRIRVLPD